MSLRSRLLLLTLLATLLPALLVSARFIEQRRSDIESDKARLASVGQRRADLLGERIQGTAQLLYGLARASVLAGKDRDACSAFLSEVRDAYPQYTGILTIHPDGRLFCDSLRSGRELDLRDRPYFKAALDAIGGVVLEPAFGRLTGLAVLQVAHPVRSANGELQFVLLASLNLQRLVAQSAPGMVGAQVLLLDRRGMLLARQPESAPGSALGKSMADTPLWAFASGQEAAASTRLTGPDGQPYLWTLADPARTGESGLRLLVGAPESSVLADTERRFAQDMTLLVVAALALFVAVWFVAEVGIRQQIQRITRMAGRLAQGDLSARVELPLPRGELGAAMAVMNDTAASLQQQRADIEQLNARLRQSQRLESLGQLTGGVAHDFNNLLTVVIGNADLLAEISPDAQQRAMAEMIVSAAQRGAALTQQLLAFARKQALAPRAVDVNQLVATLDTMLRPTLGEHIEVELIRGAGLWPALVDAGQLENALINLCVNARDAMPGGGRLTLETANVRLDADYAERHDDLKPGQYVMVAVSDTGQGIAPEHLEQVFQPFFTTKEKGKGTGLGLAMVYGFVKQSAGHVGVYSERGQGTTMKLYLPRATELDTAQAEPLPETTVVGGSEKLLLVEDDEGVRRYAAHQLGTLGYQVIEAAQGAQALELLAQHSDIALLFTDVVMPGGMNGRALADAARQLRPGLRVLYTSGYTENAIVHHGRLDVGVQLLAKPYRRSDLARAIRAALR